MERIFTVKNGDFREVNQWLQKGGKVKIISSVPQVVSAYGYANGRDMWVSENGNYAGDIFAYVVVEFN